MSETTTDDTALIRGTLEKASRLAKAFSFEDMHVEQKANSDPVTEGIWL